jgi:hypothetical protein
LEGDGEVFTRETVTDVATQARDGAHIQSRAKTPDRFPKKVTGAP